MESYLVEQLTSGLSEVSPSVAAIVRSHEDGRAAVRPGDLLSEAIYIGVEDWKSGYRETLGQLARFVGQLLASDSEPLRALASDSFVFEVAMWRRSEVLQEVMSAWPPAVVDAVTSRRDSLVHVIEGVWADRACAVGAGGYLEVLWAVAGPIDAMAVHDRVLYTAGEEVKAISLDDGSLVWLFAGHDGESLEGGPPRLHRLGSDRILVEVPYEFRLTLDAQTGQEVGWTEASEGSALPDWEVFRDWPAGGFRVESLDAKRLRVTDVDGRTLIVFTSERPNVDVLPPMQVGNVWLIHLQSGDVLAMHRT